MWILLTKIKKHLAESILLAMIAGLFIGFFIDTQPLNVLILPLTIMMVFPMMVNLNLKQLLKKGDFKLISISQLVNFVVIPLAAFGIGSVFFQNQPMIFLGFMLMAVLPTSGMTISWTGFSKGNVNGALKITITGLLLGAILAPLLLKLFFGETISIPVYTIIKQVLIVVLIPLATGLLTRYIMVRKIGEQKYNKKWKSRFPLFSSLGVIFVIFIATSLKAKTIISDPLIVLNLIIPIVIFYLFNFTFTTVLGHYFCKEKNVTALVYGTAIRNLSIALAIAMTAFNNGDSSVALIIAISYIFQVQFAAWYLKVIARMQRNKPVSISK